MPSRTHSTVLVVTPRPDFLQVMPVVDPAGASEVSLALTEPNAITACKFHNKLKLVVVDVALRDSELLLGQLERDWSRIPVMLFSAAEISPSAKGVWWQKFRNIGPIVDCGRSLLPEVERFLA